MVVGGDVGEEDFKIGDRMDVMLLTRRGKLEREGFVGEVRSQVQT